MPNVLIRDVPDDDLRELKAAAADRNVSLQSYLLDAVYAQATYLRRQAALARTGRRLHGRSPVGDDDRQAVLDAVEAAHAERADQLLDRAP